MFCWGFFIFLFFVVVFVCLFCFHSFFSLCFSLGNFFLTYIQVHWFFPQLCCLSTKTFLIYIIVFTSSISFYSFYPLMTLPICACTLSAFFITAFNTLVIVALKSLCNNSNIWVIIKFASDDYFVSSDFSWFLACLAIFCWNISSTGQQTLR